MFHSVCCVVFVLKIHKTSYPHSMHCLLSKLKSDTKLENRDSVERVMFSHLWRARSLLRFFASRNGKALCRMLSESMQFHRCPARTCNKWLVGNFCSCKWHCSPFDMQLLFFFFLILIVNVLSSSKEGYFFGMCMCRWIKGRMGINFSSIVVLLLCECSGYFLG